MTSARRTSSRPDGTTVRELPNDSQEINHPPRGHHEPPRREGVRGAPRALDGGGRLVSPLAVPVQGPLSNHRHRAKEGEASRLAKGLWK